jgi:hypothetical protein
MSDKIHSPAALPPGKNPVRIKYEGESALEPVWTFWRKLKISGFYRDSNTGSSSP